TVSVKSSLHSFLALRNRSVSRPFGGSFICPHQSTKPTGAWRHGEDRRSVGGAPFLVRLAVFARWEDVDGPGDDAPGQDDPDGSDGRHGAAVPLPGGGEGRCGRLVDAGDDHGEVK